MCMYISIVFVKMESAAVYDSVLWWVKAMLPTLIIDRCWCDMHSWKLLYCYFLFFCGWNLRKNTCLYINVWLFTYGIMYKKTGYNIIQLTAKVLVLGVYVYIYIFSSVNKMFKSKTLNFKDINLIHWQEVPFRLYF